MWPSSSSHRTSSNSLIPSVDRRGFGQRNKISRRQTIPVAREKTTLIRIQRADLISEAYKYHAWRSSYLKFSQIRNPYFKHEPPSWLRHRYIQHDPSSFQSGYASLRIQVLFLDWLPRPETRLDTARDTHPFQVLIGISDSHKMEAKTTFQSKNQLL